MQPKPHILTVSELSLALKQHIESRFAGVAVQGEVSNLKEQSSGHIYFTLKDAEAQISAVLFKGNTRTLSKMPKNGDQVLLKGEISLYPPRGYYQIIVRELTYTGIGALLLKLHETKLQLQERGWFNKAHKKLLPKYPKTIGIVTSPTGAVIQDIINILSRRVSRFHVILNPVKVQGEGASEEIARAIGDFNRFKLADVLIVGRGGGSLEDLWAFNEERLASAIFHSEIPIICAVGHETDYCIADFVADVRAPTPSAAAEIVTAETAHQLHFLSQAKERLHNRAKTLIYHLKKQLNSCLKHPYLFSPYSFFSSYVQRLDELSADLDNIALSQIAQKRSLLFTIEKQVKVLDPRNQIRILRDKVLYFDQALRGLIKERLFSQSTLMNAGLWQKKIDMALSKGIAIKKERLKQLLAHLHSIDPKNLLTKGYCILFHDKKENVITSTRALKKDDRVCLVLQDGKADLLVERTY